jgi:ABC-type multidrug transport system fused ATPase/permease subunit
VVNDGQIAEHGTHEELLKLSGLYARLHELQFSDDGNVAKEVVSLS